MKLFVYPHIKEKSQIESLKLCISQLELDKDVICALSKENSLKTFGDENHCAFGPEECDYIISFGGDGTLLRASKIALANNKRLAGINNGRVGYLCLRSAKEIDGFIPQLQSLKASERTTLSTDFRGEERTAVNEIVVFKETPYQTIEVAVSSDGKELMRFIGDGIIVCTPTGSSGYNMSAGGPLIDHKAEVFAITPICAHSLGVHPFVCADSGEIEIKIIKGKALLCIDDETLGAAEANIKIVKGKKHLLLITK